MSEAAATRAEPAFYWVDDGVIRGYPTNANEAFFGDPPWRRDRDIPKHFAAVHSWTYACLKARANGIASVDLRVVTGSRRDPQPVDTHEIQRLIDAPNPVQTIYQFLQLWQGLKDRSGMVMVIFDPFMTGESPRPFNASRVPQEMWAQDAAQWEPLGREKKENGETGALLPISYEEAAVGGADEWRNRSRPNVRYPADQVVFHKSIEGTPVEAARVAAEGDYLAADFNRSFIQKGCRPSGWLESHPPTAGMAARPPLNDDQREQLRKSVDEVYGGTKNAGKLAIFEGMRFVPNPQNRDDMQWLEGREFSVDELAAVYGVPKALLGKTGDITYANHEGQVRVFYENTMFPEMKAFEDAMWTGWLRNMPGRPVFLEFDRAGIPAMQSDLHERAATASTFVEAGWPRNDVNERLQLGMPEDPSGAIGLVPAGMIPTDAASAPLPEPEPEVDDQPAEGEVTPEQVTAILAIVAQVKNGTLPADSAKEALSIGYDLSPEQINALIDPAEEEPAPAPDEPQEDDEESDDEDAEEEDERAVRPRMAARVAFRRGLRVVRQKRRAALERTASEDRKRWERFEHDHIRRVEAQFVTKFRGLFFKQRNDVRKAVAAADRECRESHRILTPDDLDAILANERRWEAAIRAALEDLYPRSIRRLGRATLKDIGIAPSGFSPAKPAYLKWIRETVADKVVGINRETVRQIRHSFMAGLAQNETPLEIRKRLERLPAFSKGRARTVAITEVGGTVNQVRQTEYADAGITEHRWVTSNDDKVRETHATVDLEVQPVGFPFSNGLRHPHDPNGAAEEVINCRCGTVAVVEIPA